MTDQPHDDHDAGIGDSATGASTMSRRRLLGAGAGLAGAAIIGTAVARNSDWGASTNLRAQDDATPAASPAASPAATPEGAGAASVELTTVDIAFEPTEFTIAADTDVTITVTNAGVLQHDFVVEDTDFATDLLNGGDSTEIVVNLPAGEYTYFCSVPGHRDAGMEGTLTVE